MRYALVLWALVLAGAPARGPVAQVPPLAVAPDPAAGFRPVLRVGEILHDPDLAEAARSGLPIRISVRVELWRDGFFDHLEGTERWTAALLYEPLGRRWLVRIRDAQSPPPFDSFEDARDALEGEYNLGLRPGRDGRYYYTAVLEVETLSLSDLEELEHWLKGELRPAVRGERSLTSAIGEGAKRLLIRVLALPARRHEARSDWFTVPRSP